MILTTLDVDPAELHRRTGWEVKPEGACKAHLCVPLPPGPLDARILAERLGMPLIADQESGTWCLGPEAGGRALTSAVFPDLVLPEWRGGDFDFRSIRGQKVFLLAWASW